MSFLPGEEYLGFILLIIITTVTATLITNKPLEEDQHVPGTILPQHGRPRDTLQLSSLLAVKLASFFPDLTVTYINKECVRSGKCSLQTQPVPNCSESEVNSEFEII